MPVYDPSSLRIVARDLEYPEGPIACADGTVLLVEIRGQRLTRVHPDGSTEPVASIPGGPNGAAFGPDGKVYVCNSGGFDWTPIPVAQTGQTLWLGAGEAPHYAGGRIDRVDPGTGSVETVYRHCGQRLDTAGLGSRKPAPGTWDPPFQLRGPDDLVFDASGSFWFTDFGKGRLRDQDVTGVYRAAADGSSIVQVVHPLTSPNGIGLSPDGKRLYVALTWARTLLWWELDPDDPGTIVPNPLTLDGSYVLSGDLPPLDSLKVDAEGNVHVAGLIPTGNTPFCNGQVVVISPAGEVIQRLTLAVEGLFTPLPSNLCFGGSDLQTVWITCGASGLLLEARSSVPGLRPAFP